MGRQVVLKKCNWPPRVCADSPARSFYNAVSVPVTGTFPSTPLHRQVDKEVATSHNEPSDSE
jgi:hypothetical protein